MPSPFTTDEVLTYWRGEGADVDRADHRGKCIHPSHHNPQNRNFQVDPESGCATCYSSCGKTWTILAWELEVHGHPTEAEAYAAINAKIGREPFSYAAPAWLFSFAPPPAIVLFSVKFLAERIARTEARLTAEAGFAMSATALYTYHATGPKRPMCTAVKIRFAGQDAEGKKRKTFIWFAHTQKGGWSTPKRLDVHPHLYRQHEWTGTEELHLLNGEKAVDRACKQWGLTNATCLPNGEGRKKWRPEYLKDLTGVQRLHVVADNDTVGRDSALFLAVQAARAGIESRVIHLPNLPVKGDLFDWIEANHTLEEYLAIARATLVVDPATSIEKDASPHAEVPLVENGETPDTAPDEEGEEEDAPLAGLAGAGTRLRKLDVVYTRDLAKEIFGAYHFAVDAGGKLYFYDDGFYQPDGEAFIRRLTKRLFLDARRSEEWVSYRAEEVIKYITADCPRLWDEPPADIINLENCLLHVVTRERFLHTPEHLSSVRLPVVYDPAADCPACRKFGAEVFPDDAVDIMFEIAAWLITVDRNIQKAILLVGEGANGKSVFLALMRCLLGRGNISAMPLQRMESDRFATSALVGKLANICADLPSEALTSSGTFKAIVGGDEVSAEYKNKNSFSLLPFCKLIFSVNEMPQAADSSDGFFRRWTVVPFNRKFAEGDPGTARRDVLLARLTTPGELSGLLNRALDALGPLRAAGRFTTSESVEEATRELRRTTDPLTVWLEEFTIAIPNASIPQTQLRSRYIAECKQTGHPFPSAKAVTKAVLSLYKGVSIGQKRDGAKHPDSYFGIGWLLRPEYGTPPPERGDYYDNGRPAPAPKPTPSFRIGDWVAASGFTEPRQIINLSDDGRIAFFADTREGISVLELRPALRAIFTDDEDTKSVQ